MKIKILLTTYLCFIGILFSTPILAQTASDNFLLKGVPCAITGEKCNLCDFMQVFVNGSNIIMGLSGAFAVLLFVYGGIVMITAYGSEARITQAKDITRATVIGMIVVFMGWMIINFIVRSLTGGGQGDWNSTLECAKPASDGVVNDQLNNNQPAELDADTIEQLDAVL